MGLFASKSRLDEIKERVDRFAKTPASAEDYDICTTMLFEDKINLGRMEVWFQFSIAVRHHLPVNEHEKLDSMVQYWFCILETNLVEHTHRIDEMKKQWKNGQWTIVRKHIQTSL